MRAHEYAGRPTCIALVRDWSRGFRVWRVDVHDFADAAVDAGHDARDEHFIGLLVMLVIIYIRDPSEFTSFPTLLLIVALLDWA